jgi:phytoene synthase
VDIFRSITLRGSRTFYTAALFFPRAVREDVFILYAFVRTVDDLVDRLPPDRKGFERMRSLTRRAFSGRTTGDILVDAFADLARRKRFDPWWTASFFASQRLDMDTTAYRDFRHLDRFIYGVADVIGLYMSAVMGLPAKARGAARLLGKSMQLINIFRDVSEDAALGRTYIPAADLRRFGLKTAVPRTAEDREKFKALMRFEVARFRAIERRARLGFRHIPGDRLLPVLAADRLYRWLAGRFERDPLVVLRKKLKPSLARIILVLLATAVSGKGT